MQLQIILYHFTEGQPVHWKCSFSPRSYCRASKTAAFIHLFYFLFFFVKTGISNYPRKFSNKVLHYFLFQQLRASRRLLYLKWHQDQSEGRYERERQGLCLITRKKGFSEYLNAS